MAKNCSDWKIQLWQFLVRNYVNLLDFGSAFFSDADKHPDLGIGQSKGEFMQIYKAPDYFTVEMSQETIGMGVRNESRECPVHWALESLDFLHDVVVDHGWIEFFVDGWSEDAAGTFFDTSDRLNTILANYDAGGEFPLGIVIVDLKNRTIDFEVDSGRK